MEENKTTFTIGIDLGKTFGYSIWDNTKLIKSGEIKMKNNSKPEELKKFLRYEIRYMIEAGISLNIDNMKHPWIEHTLEVVVETGQGFMSKNAWRGFGVQEWVVEDVCRDFKIKLHSYHISWLKNYNRRLEKTNENDAIELVEYHFKKVNKTKEEIKL